MVFYYSEVGLWTLSRTHMRQFFYVSAGFFINSRATKNIILVKVFYLTDVLVLCLRGSDFIKMKIKIIWRNDLQINPAYLWFIWLIPGQLRTIFWFHIQKSTFKSKKWPVPILRWSLISYESYHMSHMWMPLKLSHSNSSWAEGRKGKIEEMGYGAASTRICD